MFVTVVVLGGGCGGDPETAGNRKGYLFDAMAQDRLTDACAMLCSDIRQRVSEDEFVRTRGATVAPILPYGGALGVGGLQSPADDMATLNSDVTQAFFEEIIGHDTGPWVLGKHYEDVPLEFWRIDMKRDGKKWTVCGFTKVRDLVRSPLTGQAELGSTPPRN